MERRINWGIAGCGRRSRDFASALVAISARKHCVMAIASRNESEVQQFISDFPWRPRAYKCYINLVHDKAIDVVFIGTSIPKRCPIALLLMMNKKHVVIEAPLCIHRQEMEKLLNIAKLHKVIMVEACVPKFSPLIASLKHTLCHYEIGDVEGIMACLGRPLYLFESGVAERIRGGGVGFRITHHFLKLLLGIINQKLNNVTATGTVDDDGVCIQMRGVLNFSTVDVNFTCTTTADSPNEIIIMGTKGYCKLKDVLDGPVSVEISTLEKGKVILESEVLDSSDYNFKSNCGYKYIIEEVTHLIHEGLLESAILKNQDSERAVYLLDYIHSNINGLILPPEY